MNNQALLGLINNAALLVALAVLYDMLGLQPNRKGRGFSVLMGIVLGLIGIALMLNPWRFSSGVVFDTRSILLSIAGLYFGLIPTVVAASIIALFRMIMGGIGTWTGVAVIFSSAGIGLAWRHFRNGRRDEIDWRELYLMGLAVHFVMLLLMLSLPHPTGVDVLRQIALPVMIIYPIGTVLLGRLLGLQQARNNGSEALRESEERLREVVHNMPVMLDAFDGQNNVVLWNQECERVTGYPAGEIIGNPQALEWLYPDAGHREQLLKDAVLQDLNFRNREWTLTAKDGSARIISWSNISGQIPIPGWHSWAIGVDVTDHRQTEEVLNRTNQRLKLLRSIDRDILVMRSPKAISGSVLGRLRELIECQRASIILFDHETNRMQFFAVDAATESVLMNGVDVPAEAGWIAEMEAAVPVFVDDTDVLEQPDYAFRRRLVEEGMRSFLYVPMKAQEELIGVLSLSAATPGFFTIEHREMAVEVAYQLAIALAQSRMVEQIQRHATELEQRVAERTAQLQAANRELEAFTYSVSHDLRAPLRAIDGFSQALLEDFGDRLDARGQHYLRRVRAGAGHMATLIDDLLRLSQVSRAVLRPTRLNLSRLAENIVNHLRDAEPDRDVEFTVPADLFVLADLNLINIVLDNLLRNAWKFTGNHPAARIEFGRQELDGETVYYVRDDGAGFDMAYASKLFGPFQRLHTMQEFEGTGVGLALVQRIIQRHGGRVWCEGAVEKGATFFFTLPQQEVIL